MKKSFKLMSIDKGNNFGEIYYELTYQKNRKNKETIEIKMKGKNSKELDLLQKELERKKNNYLIELNKEGCRIIKRK